jgi:serine/threonine protein kinase
MPTDTSRLVAGRYQLAERLGRGGMGVVWAAEDSVLQRRVAVKEVETPTGLNEEERAALEARVMREARAAARLNHPNAVTVYDVVEDEGRTYIVMELVQAPSLTDLIATDGPVSSERAAQIGLDVLGALEAAHSEGIVHRDVKPGNVMISPGGRAKLGDFGIASVKGDPKITSTGLILGSPSYMAPEQATEGTSGPATDLWALGALLYFAVEGRPPFDKGQPLPTLAAVVGESPRPMQNATELQDVVDRLLNKDPAARPRPDTIRSVLTAVSQGWAAHTTAVAPPAERTRVETRQATPPAVAQPLRRERRSPMPWLVGLAALLLAGFAVWALTNNGANEPERANEKRNQPQERQQTEDQAGNEDSSIGLGDSGQVDTSEWTTHTDEATGYTISYPAEWSVSQDGTLTDFTDPATGAYLRIDWTDSPGADPVAAWESLENDFSARHDDYEQIAMEATTYKGMDAAWWEFTYTDGVQLHAVDLGFVTNDGSYGFALNFQTPAEDWEESQDIFSAFQDSFQVPS